jgi:hypothetical protein
VPFTHPGIAFVIKANFFGKKLSREQELALSPIPFPAIALSCSLVSKQSPSTSSLTILKIKHFLKEIQEHGVVQQKDFTESEQAEGYHGFMRALLEIENDRPGRMDKIRSDIIMVCM